MTEAKSPAELMEWIAAGAKPASKPPVAGAAHCSADALKHERQIGYANGYAAALRRLDNLKAEISKLRKTKTLPITDAHDTTLEYLIATSEALARAAALLIEARTGINPPNNRLSDSDVR